jgi:hypothetical protein
MKNVVSSDSRSPVAFVEINEKSRHMELNLGLNGTGEGHCQVQVEGERQ